MEVFFFTKVEMK